MDKKANFSTQLHQPLIGNGNWNEELKSDTTKNNFSDIETNAKFLEIEDEEVKAYPDFENEGVPLDSEYKYTKFVLSSETLETEFSQDKFMLELSSNNPIIEPNSLVKYTYEDSLSLWGVILKITQGSLPEIMEGL